MSLASGAFTAVEAGMYQYGGAVGLSACNSFNANGTGISASFVSGNMARYSATAQGNVDNETSGIDSWFVSRSGGATATNACFDTAQTYVEGAVVTPFNDAACD